MRHSQRPLLALACFTLLAACAIEDGTEPRQPGSDEPATKVDVAAMPEAEVASSAIASVTAAGYDDAEVAAAFESGYRAAHAAVRSDAPMLGRLTSREAVSRSALSAAEKSGLEEPFLSAYRQGYETLLTRGTDASRDTIARIVPSLRVGNVDSPERIRDHYIVTFADDAPESAVRALTEHAKGRGGVEFTYDTSVHGLAATLPASAVNTFRHNPHVRTIEADEAVHLDVTQQNPAWHLSRIDTRALTLGAPYTYTYTGRGVDVYVLDTGVQFTHTDFGGRASLATSIIKGETSPDGNGHGTHVAGIIGSATYGVAKGATIKGVRVLSAPGSGSNAGAITGLEYVAKQVGAGRRIVANLSFGSAKSDAMNRAVANASLLGIVVVAAAGNDNGNACQASPASAPSAITVAASDNRDTKAYFSNYGPCVDLFAPGVAITSLWKGSNNAINTITGTSMAAPVVAGIAAQYLEANPSHTPAQVSAAIVSYATKGVVKNVPPTTPNALAYTPL